MGHYVVVGYDVLKLLRLEFVVLTLLSELTNLGNVVLELFTEGLVLVF